jgi:hypothetical protein
LASSNSNLDLGGFVFDRRFLVERAPREAGGDVLDAVENA